MTPSNTLCWVGNLLVDNTEVPTTPRSAYQMPRTFTLDKNHNAMTVATPGDSAIAPPPWPPKPSQADKNTSVGQPQQSPPVREDNRSLTAIPKHNTLPAMDNSRLHRAFSCETHKYPMQGRESASWSAESPGKTIAGRSDSASSDDHYVHMSAGPHHFD